MRVKVLNVFCNEDGQYGNPVGIVDEGEVGGSEERQRIASAAGFSETVFIEDVESAQIAIHNPQEEISFSGHAAVGAAWYIANRLGNVVESLQGRDGRIQAWTEGAVTWVRTELKATPPWWHERVADVETLEAIRGASPIQDHVQVWTWIDEAAGIVRSRTFAPGWGIPEDEANGSGCMKLAAALGRELVVRHGRGSVILARYRDLGYAEAGGSVAEASDLVLE